MMPVYLASNKVMMWKRPSRTASTVAEYIRFVLWFGFGKILWVIMALEMLF